MNTTAATHEISSASVTTWKIERVYSPVLEAAGVALQRLLLIRPSTPTEALWATRQASASGSCALVMAWLARLDTAALRRLQLAAEQGATPLFLLRARSAARHASPALLRLALSPTLDGLQIDILKRRGPPAAGPIQLCWDELNGIAPTQTDPATRAQNPHGARHLSLVG